MYKIWLLLLILIYPSSVLAQNIVVIDCSTGTNGAVRCYNMTQQSTLPKQAEPSVIIYDATGLNLHSSNRALNWGYLGQKLKSYSEHYGVDPNIIYAMIEVESGFDPAALSPAGAIGLMQLMPATAQALGADPWDPEQNLYAGIRYFKLMLERHKTLENALAAYNAGSAAVYKYGGVPPYPETERYVKNVIYIYRHGNSEV